MQWHYIVVLCGFQVKHPILAFNANKAPQMSIFKFQHTTRKINFSATCQEDSHCQTCQVFKATKAQQTPVDPLN